MQIKVWAINTYVYWKLLKHYLSGCKFSGYCVRVVSEKKVTCKEKLHLSYKFKVELFLKPANFLLSLCKKQKMILHEEHNQMWFLCNPILHHAYISWMAAIHFPDVSTHWQPTNQHRYNQLKDTTGKFFNVNSRELQSTCCH